MTDDGDAGELAELVNRERWARDSCRWEEMRECFHEESLVDISWVRASGPDFVERSRASFEAGVRSVHVISPIAIERDGDRAIANFGALVEVQSELRGTLCALSAFARLVERLERRDGEWRIAELRGIYHFDKLAPVIPGEPIAIDRERVAPYRPSYRMLSYWVSETQGEEGVRHDLPGIDRPDLVDALHAANEEWLRRRR